MSFVSLSFLIFLGVAIFFYFITPKDARFIILLIANTAFYWIGCQFNIFYLIGSIFSVYIGGLIISKIKDKTKLYNSNIKNIKKENESIKDSNEKSDIQQLKNNQNKIKELNKKIKKKNILKKFIFILIIILNIAMLSILKEHSYIIGHINKYFHTNMVVPKIVVPMAISYYVLIALGYLIDVYLGKIKATKNFLKMYLTMTFFPLMVEGPIIKYQEVADQLWEGQKFNFNNFKYGYLRIVWGYFKKLVIADRVAIYVNTIFTGTHTGFTVFIGMMLYVLQIYSEFSGCMDIVIGIGQIFGIKLPENFKQPFLSKNVSEFWRRWHITLGRWLKDYIYFPAVMSKLNMKITGKAHKKLPKFLADVISNFIPLFLVWLSMGIWHAYGKKYIIYGMYWFTLIILGMLFKPVFDWIIKKLKMKTDCFSWRLFQELRTFLLVTIGLTIFRAPSLHYALQMMKNIFVTGTDEVGKLAGGYPNVNLILVCILVLIVVDLFKDKVKDIPAWMEKQNVIFRYFVFVVALMSVLVFGMYGYGYDPASFIYQGF